MNDLQGPPASERLRQALGGIAGIFDAQLRHSEEYGAEIEAIRARHETESDRLATLERMIAADRAALQQMRSIFAEVARHSDPTSAPLAAKPPQLTRPATHEPEPERESSSTPAVAFPPEGLAATGEPVVLTTEPPLTASTLATVSAASPTDGRFSSLSLSDLVAASSRGPKSAEFAD